MLVAAPSIQDKLQTGHCQQPTIPSLDLIQTLIVPEDKPECTGTNAVIEIQQGCLFVFLKTANLGGV
jgi:hypothetical protein